MSITINWTEEEKKNLKDMKELLDSFPRLKGGLDILNEILESSNINELPIEKIKLLTDEEYHFLRRIVSEKDFDLISDMTNRTFYQTFCRECYESVELILPKEEAERRPIQDDNDFFGSIYTCLSCKYPEER